MTEREKNLRAMTVPLLAWYDLNKRTLPWRGTHDPYQVWVSEIMLQQTRVTAVIPYYQRWMEALPTVEALAATDEERLMKLWQGLGYYSRARNLRKAARMIVEDCGGQFPKHYEELLKLPGVGDYTAGAIASIAFDQPVPAVDGNVMRLAARVANIQEDIMDAGTRKTLRRLMEGVMPQDRPGEYNQALMDLGAVICLPNGEPECGRCPLAELCEAKRLDLQEVLPVRARKAKRRIEEMTVYLLVRDGEIAMRRRSEKGLLAGLWEFPHVSGTLDEASAGGPVERWGLTAQDWQKKVEARHIFTHVEWHMTGYLLMVKGECREFLWVDRDGLEALAVPSAFTKYLTAAREALAK